MGSELSEPVEYGLIIQYPEVADVAPLVIVCAFSLLLITVWFVVVVCRLRSRRR